MVVRSWIQLCVWWWSSFKLQAALLAASGGPASSCRWRPVGVQLGGRWGPAWRPVGVQLGDRWGSSLAAKSPLSSCSQRWLQFPLFSLAERCSVLFCVFPLGGLSRIVHACAHLICSAWGYWGGGPRSYMRGPHHMMHHAARRMPVGASKARHVLLYIHNIHCSTFTPAHCPLQDASRCVQAVRADRAGRLWQRHQR